jgi:membrane-bound serine protease (ClpP class)
VVLIYFKDVVDLGIAPFVARALAQAEESEAALFLLEMDTPGGRVDAALKIKDALLAAKVPTMVFINRQAISAGALITLGADYIAWAPGATMGAATPVQFDGPGGEMKESSEKIVSFMRGVMRSTAEAKGRDPLVAEAMVDPELDLPGFAPKGKLLTASFSQAPQLGLLDFKADDRGALLTQLGLGDRQVITVQENWAEKVARAITHPAVSSILMSLGILGIIIEFYTPGFGLAGIAGAISLLAFFFGHMVVNLAGLEELLLLLLGLLLVGVEVFLTPGLGLAGVAGVVAILAALALALVGLRLDLALDSGVLGGALVRVFGAVAVAGLGLLAFIRFFPTLKPVRRLVLSETISASAGGLAGVVLDPGLLGRELRAETALRPVGYGRLDGKRLELQTQGQHLQPGTLVRILDIHDGHLLVEPVPEPAAPPPVPPNPASDGGSHA